MEKFPFDIEITGTTRISLTYGEYKITNYFTVPKQLNAEQLIDKEIYNCAEKLKKKIFGEENFDTMFSLKFFPHEIKKESKNKYRLWYKHTQRYAINKHFTKIGNIEYVDVYGGLMVSEGDMFYENSDGIMTKILPGAFLKNICFKTLKNEYVQVPLNPFFIEKLNMNLTPNLIDCEPTHEVKFNVEVYEWVEKTFESISGIPKKMFDAKNNIECTKHSERWPWTGFVKSTIS